mgnify:CR=1 FL=1
MTIKDHYFCVTGLDFIRADGNAYCLSGIIRSVCHAAGDHRMELGHAFYLASDGVSCSHSGGDALCIMDHLRRAADRVYLRAFYVGMRYLVQA